MRQTCIFSGTSHPGLVDKICNWLGDTPSKVALTKFKNGETSVEIRELASGIGQDCFVSNALQKHRCETKMSSSCNLAAPSTSLPPSAQSDLVVIVIIIIILAVVLPC